MSGGERRAGGNLDGEGVGGKRNKFGFVDTRRCDSRLNRRTGNGEGGKSQHSPLIDSIGGKGLQTKIKSGSLKKGKVSEC